MGASIYTLEDDNTMITVDVNKVINQSLMVNYFLLRFTEGTLFIQNTRIQSQYDECAFAVTKDLYNRTFSYPQGKLQVYHLSDLPKISNIMVSTFNSNYVKLFGVDADPNQIVYDSAEDQLLNGTHRWDRRPMPSVFLPYSELGMYTKTAVSKDDDRPFESYVRPVDSPSWSFSNNVILSTYRNSVYVKGGTTAAQAREDESLSIAYVEYELRGIRVYINKTPEELKGWRYIRVIVKDSTFVVTSESNIRYNCYQIMIIDRATGKMVNNYYPSSTVFGSMNVSKIDLNGSDFKATFRVINHGVIQCSLTAYNRDDYQFLFDKLTARNFTIVMNDGQIPPISSMKYRGLYLGDKFNNIQTDTLPTETYIAVFTLEYNGDFTCASPLTVAMSIPDAESAFVYNVKTYEVQALNAQNVSFTKGE